MTTHRGAANMAAMSITLLASFFSGEPKSTKRGENHYNSQHVELFEYSIGARAIMAIMALDWYYESLLI